MKQLSLLRPIETKTKTLAIPEPSLCEICGKPLCAIDPCVDKVVRINIMNGASNQPPGLAKIWQGFRR